MDTYVPWLALNTYPDDILSTPCEEIAEVTVDIHEFANDMTQTMYACDGIGLAAPQVGRSIRLIVIDCSKDATGLKHFVNPRIVASRGTRQRAETCISFPGLKLRVSRAIEVDVESLDLKGNKTIYNASGLEANCIQHEIDHLDGITFLDRVSRQQRRHALRRWEKEKNSYHTTSEI